jgi:hypothetical protein
MFFRLRTITSKQSHTLLARGFSTTHHVLRQALPSRASKPSRAALQRHFRDLAAKIADRPQKRIDDQEVATLGRIWKKLLILEGTRLRKEGKNLERRDVPSWISEEPKDIAQDLRGKIIRDVRKLFQGTEEKPGVSRSRSIEVGDPSSQNLSEPQAPFSPSTKARPNLIDAASGGPSDYYATFSKSAEDKPILLSPSQNRPTARKMAPLGQSNKVQPSSASGGIPNPTPQYLANTDELPRPAASPRQLLVVIDLNGTLLYRPSRKFPTKFTPRPHAQKFLEYCVDTFTVVIWSSARQENVEPMCQTILTPRLRQKVVAIWGRESFNLSPSDYNMRVQCYKRLTALWTNPGIAASHPDYARGGKWDQTNTVLIDDSSEKARSEPFNLVEIPEFFGDHREVGDILPQVHDYLNFLSLHENVSATIRNQPFRARSGNPHEAVGLELPLQNPGMISAANQ